MLLFPPFARVTTKKSFQVILIASITDYFIQFLELFYVSSKHIVETLYCNKESNESCSIYGVKNIGPHFLLFFYAAPQVWIYFTHWFLLLEVSNKSSIISIRLTVLSQFWNSCLRDSNFRSAPVPLWLSVWAARSKRFSSIYICIQIIKCESNHCNANIVETGEYYFNKTSFLFDI